MSPSEGFVFSPQENVRSALYKVVPFQSVDRALSVAHRSPMAFEKSSLVNTKKTKSP